jgi:tetratricopeptide (TPR) repeat protein
MVDLPGKNFSRFVVFVIVLVVCAGTYGCSSGDPERFFQRGIDAMEAENSDEAVIWFRKALQADPKLAIAYYKLGQLYHEKGDDRQAFGVLNRAVQLDPKLKKARKELAFLLVENKSLEQAAKVCRQYLEVNGDDKDIYLILGNVLAYTKKLDEGIKVMKEAMAKYPDATSIQLNLGKMLIIRGDVAEGRSLVEAVAQNNPDDIRSQMALAQMYQKIERFDLAILLLEQMKKDFPESPLPFLALAQISLKKNQPDQAQAILAEAERAGIHDSGLFRINAIIHHRQGDSATALKYFEKAVEFAEERELQNNRMIFVDYHIFLKNYKEAQEILEQIIAEDDSKKVLKSKVVELFLAQGEFEQARTSVDSLLKENSSDARGHFLKGLMMMQDKDVVEAREQFSKAKELEPDVAENQFLYGVTFMEESQDVSITEISESLKKNPNMLRARMALAELFARKGDFQKSLDELDKIIEKIPTDSKARVLRVSVLLKMNNPEAALSDAQFLVEAEPKVTWHVFRLAEIYFFIKKYDEALPLYKNVQKETPESLEILNRIVAIYMLEKEFKQALTEVDSFLAKFPEDSQAVIVKAKIYLSQGDLDLAEKILLPEANKDDTVTPILLLAEIYKTRNEDVKVEQFYEKALVLVPDNVEIMMKMADFQLKIGANAKAIEIYEEILQKKEDYLPAMNNLAFLYAEDGGNLDRALELANAVYKQLPENADVADTLGWILVLKKAYSRAESYLQKAMNIKADTPTIIFHMGMLRFGQKLQSEAEALLKTAVRRGLQGSELVKATEALAQLEDAKKKLLAAKSEREKGNTLQAIALFERILEDDGFDGVIAADLAILYAEQGKNIPKAIALAQRAYDSQPKNVQIIDALGWVYYHQGSLLMAKRYIEQALKEDELYGAAQVHLAAVYLKKGELYAARESLEKAKTLNLSAMDKKQLESLSLELRK